MGNTQFETDDAGIIQTIKDSVATEKIDVKKGEFTNRPIFAVPEKDFAPSINCSSLTAIVDFITREVDASARGELVVHIQSPHEVQVLRQIGAADDPRFRPLVAFADVPSIKLLHGFVGQEEAMIELQSKFVASAGQEEPEAEQLPFHGVSGPLPRFSANGDLGLVLKNIGSIVLDDELKLDDDGVTQEFTVRSGIDRGDASIKNPVILRPYRTFTEVDQPATPYILRLKKDGQKLSIALFEADGGAWRNTARQSIKKFLTEALGADIAILA